jgi:hypothetical protein
MQRVRLLAPSLVMLLGCTLALAACNSSSVSGSQPKASNSTTAESKSGTGARTQGLVGAVISYLK